MGIQSPKGIPSSILRPSRRRGTHLCLQRRDLRGLLLHLRGLLLHQPAQRLERCPLRLRLRALRDNILGHEGHDVLRGAAQAGGRVRGCPMGAYTSERRGASP